MNKYNIKEFLHKTLKDHLSSLHKTSFDSDNQEHLCNDKITANVYDFDDYIANKSNGIKLPASPDAILVGDKKLYFIEFKNQIPAKIDKENMRNKFKAGTAILKGLLKDFMPRDVRFIFCIVHKIEHKRFFNSSHIEALPARFGLEEENKKLGEFYSEIIGDNIDYYKNRFKQLKC